MERSLKYRLCTEERTGDLPLGFMELILSKDITSQKVKTKKRKQNWPIALRAQCQ